MLLLHDSGTHSTSSLRHLFCEMMPSPDLNIDKSPSLKTMPVFMRRHLAWYYMLILGLKPIGTPKPFPISDFTSSNS